MLNVFWGCISNRLSMDKNSSFIGASSGVLLDCEGTRLGGGSNLGVN